MAGSGVGAFSIYVVRLLALLLILGGIVYKDRQPG